MITGPSISPIIKHKLTKSWDSKSPASTVNFVILNYPLFNIVCSKIIPIYLDNLIFWRILCPNSFSRDGLFSGKCNRILSNKSVLPCWVFCSEIFYYHFIYSRKFFYWLSSISSISWSMIQLPKKVHISFSVQVKKTSQSIKPIHLGSVLPPLFQGKIWRQIVRLGKLRNGARKARKIDSCKISGFSPFFMRCFFLVQTSLKENTVKIENDF